MKKTYRRNHQIQIVLSVMGIILSFLGGLLGIPFAFILAFIFIIVGYIYAHYSNKQVYLERLKQIELKYAECKEE